MRSERVLTLTGRMSARLVAAIDDLGALLPVGMALQFKGDFPGNLRHLFTDGRLDFSKLVRVDSHPAADNAFDVLLSFEPSDLFLELLAALRAGQLDFDVVEHV